MRAGGQSSPSPLHLPTDSGCQCTHHVAELARGRRWSINLEPNFCPGRDLNSEPHGWQSCTLTTGPPRNPQMKKEYYSWTAIVGPFEGSPKPQVFEEFILLCIQACLYLLIYIALYLNLSKVILASLIIHSGYFYSTSSILPVLPDITTTQRHSRLQHWYCVEVNSQSATGNCEWRTYPRSLRDG